MTIQNWRVFVTVCKYNSITKAAHAMHVAQPSISRTIKEIEQYYDIKLFERVNKRLYITPMGQELFYRAKEAVQAFDAIEESIYGEESIRIGASVMIGKYIIEDAIQEYQQISPAARFDVRIDVSEMLIGQIISGDLSFAFIERPSGREELEETVFSGDYLVALCNTSHPYAQKQTVSLKELLQQKILLKSPGNTSRHLFDEELKKYGLTADPVFESSSTDEVIDYLLENGGIAVLPFLQARRRFERERLVRLEVEELKLRRNYYVVLRKDRILPNNMKEFVEICKKKANEVNQNLI